MLRPVSLQKKLQENLNNTGQMNSCMNGVINTILEKVDLENFILHQHQWRTNVMAVAACSAAFFVGAKVYYIHGKRGVDNSENKVIELPVPNIPYYRTLSKSELAVLKTIDKLGNKCLNLQLREAIGISAQKLGIS
jgi:hypothetical protein